MWATLKQDLFLILEDPFHGPTDNWEYLHRLAYNICIGRCYHLPEGLEARFVSRPGMPQPAALYRVFEESLERYLQEHTMQKWRQLSAELHCGLTAYVELWDRYNVGLDIVHRIFHYLNREYVAREHGGTRRLGGFSATKDSRPLCGIHTLGIIHWRDLICIPLAKELMDNFMVYTERLRRGDNVERSILRRLTESFLSLGEGMAQPLQFYQESFESVFLTRTSEFYNQEAQQQLAICSLSEYMKMMENRLREEETKILPLIHPSTKKALLSCCVQVVVGSRMDLILSEFQSYIKGNQYEDLRRMYSLLQLTDQGLQLFSSALASFVTQEGQSALESLSPEGQKDVITVVSSIISVYRYFLDILDRCFDDAQTLKQVVEKGCQQFINDNSIVHNSRTLLAEYMAKFLSIHLRPSSKEARKLGPEATSRAISDTIRLSGMLNQKDVFQKFYQRQLAKRLIHQSYDKDAEYEAITKLQEVYSWDYYHRLQRMFTDVNLCRELTDTFRHGYVDRLPVDFSVLICTTVHWPLSFVESRFSLPEELTRCCDLFSSYYHTLHTGRQLLWLHNHSFGVIRYQTEHSKVYEIHCTTYQMSVLLLFNSVPPSGCLTVNDIRETLKLDEMLLILHLDSMFKRRLLAVLEDGTPKARKGAKGLSASSQVVLNSTFKSPTRKVVLHIPTQKESAEENKAARQSIMEDRKFAIQAAIVRIMKARQKLEHTILLQEVISQLCSTFQPTIQDIKRNLDALIEKEFIEREISQLPSNAAAEASEGASAMLETRRAGKPATFYRYLA